MSMNKMVGFVAILSIVLAAPVLGVWIYDGTDVYVSEPDSDSDPYGTWSWSWDGDGSVSADAFNLDASGWTSGECSVGLYPYYGDPLSESVYVASYVEGRSYYHWVPDETSKEITIRVSVALGSSGISYSGNAVDDTHVSTVSSSSGASAYGGGGGSYVGYYYPGGSGSGSATTQSGASASNNPGNVSVSTNDTDWGYDPPLLYHQWYEGDLGFTASTNSDPYSDEPEGVSFTASSCVSGYAGASGNITINDPNYHYLYLYAEASYSVIGTSNVDISGNIQ